MPPRDEDPLSGDEMMLLEEEEEQQQQQQHEEEEEEDDEELPVRRRKKKHKKMKMGDESGLTDAERRKLRRDQRELAKALQDGPVHNNNNTKDNDEGDNDDDNGDFVTQVREKNNQLFEKVAYTREAVLDAENVCAIASKMSKKVDDMIQVPRFDATKFVSKLKYKLSVPTGSNGQSYFDWKTLGTEAGVCFNSIPSHVVFLAGPLENGRAAPEKRRTQTVRQKKAVEEDADEEEPEELAKKERKSADQLSQAERNMKDMKKILKDKSHATRASLHEKYEEIKENDPENEMLAREQLKERGNEVDFVKFLVNPKSFTQTIENIFNFSFLVKKGEAQIKMRKKAPLGSSQEANPLDLPTSGCFVSVGKKDEKDYDGPSRQCVIPFTMKDWRRLREAYGLDECDIPHRKGTKQTKKAASSQSQSPAPSQELLGEDSEAGE